jgi:hypothetical protein
MLFLGNFRPLGESKLLLSLEIDCWLLAKAVFVQPLWCLKATYPPLKRIDLN